MSDLEQPQPSGVSRRTVTKAMAWAVPAIALAAPVPAFAASCIPTIIVDPDKSCKAAGQDQNYALYFLVSGSCPGVPCTGVISAVWPNTGSEPNYYFGPGGSHPADGVTPMYLCEVDNMTSKMWVTATITCGANATTADYLINMPNFNSAGNTCATPPVCAS